MQADLSGKIALVTGASRGVGRGVAQALAAAGATVYLTGRTWTSGSSAVPVAGGLEDAAAEIGAAGGRAIPVVCDHRDDAQVRALFDRIAAEQGGLDILVNNVWGGYETLHAGQYEAYNADFWTQPLELWDSMFQAGVRAHYVSSVLGAPLLIGRRGLIVNISFFAAQTYDGNVAYGVAKAATDRLVRDMAHDLRPHGVGVVSLYPGLVRTEGIMKWAAYLDLSNAESPQFTGRAVAALAADPEALRHTGQVRVVAELAREYGFTDVDGRQPESLRAQFEARG